MFHYYYSLLFLFCFLSLMLFKNLYLSIAEIVDIQTFQMPSKLCCLLQFLDRYAIEIQPGIYLSRDSRLLEDISQGHGPLEFLFMLGYAGWGAGQLESELVDNSWLTVPADFEVLFHTPVEQKWRLAAQKSYNFV